MSQQRAYNIAHRVSFMGLLFALAVVLSIVEGLIPALPSMPPGIKLGLSNIVTMFCLFVLDKKSAFCILLLKSLFAFLVRGGMIAAALSFTGGLFSILTMLLLLLITSSKLSYLLISIVGGVMHNVGQLVMVMILLQTQYVWYYFPVLLLSGVGMGLVTGFIYKVISPYLERLQIRLK